VEKYLIYILTGFISFAFSLILKYVGPKSRLVWWQPHLFEFIVPLEEEGLQPLRLLTQSITIQNLGTAPTNNIEIAHKTKPDFFKLQPPLDYEESEVKDGSAFIVKIKSLAPNEFFTVEFLTYKQFSELLYIRSEWGHAKLIPVQPSRIYPTWHRVILMIFIGAGVISVSYFLIQFIFFLWPKIYN